MPQVTYLDVFEQRDGGFRQDIDTVSSEDLLSAGSRESAPEAQASWRRSYRAVSRVREVPGRGYELASLQSAFYRAALKLLMDPQLMRRYEHRSLTITLNPRLSSINVLRGRDFSENLEVWLRNLPQDEMLIELPDLDRERLSAAVRELEAYSQQLAAMTMPAEQAQSAALQVPARETSTSPADLAAQRRLDLAQGWLLASAVSQQLGSSASNSSVMANQRRRDGDLLGVWIPSERAYRYPPWQFDRDGQPFPQLKEILDLLRGPGGMASSDRRTSGWQEVEWFMSPHALLEGSRPYEVLRDDPERILEIATEQFVEDADAGGF